MTDPALSNKSVAEAAIVEFQNVGKTYGAGGEATTAIRDISFEVINKPGRGEFISLLGPSGCGKSTILRLIAGLRPQFPATTGTVKVMGKPVEGPGPDRGMVFQDYTSFDNRTVLENIAFGLECSGVGRSERETRARIWMGKVGLEPGRNADKFPHQLSGGMRQRVAIARTLILSPHIILMDEPFGALDPATRLNMQDLLIGLWREQEATVFFVTHSIEEAIFLGDCIYVLKGTPGTIVKKMELPSPDRPAREVQREAGFRDAVCEIRDIVETSEVRK